MTSTYRNEPISVTDANHMASRTLNEIGSIIIFGEISGCNPSSSGHKYFDLKDSTSALPCMIFKNNTDAWSKAENGREVIVTGHFNVYEKAGKLNFIITKMELAGKGALQAEIEARKARYTAMGWFDPARKRPLPAVIRRVGVITSDTGAVFHDILNVTGRRAPEIAIRLYPSPVQGKGAEFIIASRIRQANDDGFADVLIVGRGGGSFEDLSPYSTDAVIQAIHDSRIPVISAVGHEVDWPISDYVADMRAGTPSIAGEKVSETAFRRRETFNYRWNELEMNAKTRFERAKSRFAEKRIDASDIQNRLNTEKMRYRSYEHIDELLRFKFDNARYSFEMTKDQMANIMKTNIVSGIADMERRCTFFENTVQAIMNRARSGFDISHRELQALDPMAILSRGYSVVSDSNGHVVKNTGAVAEGDRITIRMNDGSVNATVSR